MQPFQAELYKEFVVPSLLKLSDREMEHYVRLKLIEAQSDKSSPINLFDTLVEISKIPVDRVQLGDTKVCFGDVSGFVQKMCDVSPYYVRPQDTDKYNSELCENIRKDFELAEAEISNRKNTPVQDYVI